MRANMNRILLPLIPLVTLTVAMEWASRKGWIPGYILPAPSAVFQTLAESSDLFIKAFGETFLASSAGLLLSLVVGFCLAILLSVSTVARSLFYPYAVFFQTVPIIAIAPLLVIWFGYGMPTVVASSFVVSLFPIIANSVSGLLSTDRILMQLFTMLGANSTQTLFKLRIPFALPQILSGVKVSAGLAVIGTIVGEFISGSGLGGVVDAARNQQRLDRVFAAVLLASLLGILFFMMISIVSVFLLKHWHPSEKD